MGYNPGMAEFYYMYVVACADGSLYTGYATDVERRVSEHNGSPRGARYTRARRPVTLVATARFTSRHEVMAAEFHFKRLARAEKDALLARAAEQPLEDVLAKRFDLRAHDDPSQTDSAGDPNTVS